LAPHKIQVTLQSTQDLVVDLILVTQFDGSGVFDLSQGSGEVVVNLIPLQ
jgi:hypothetical protein